MKSEKKTTASAREIRRLRRALAFYANKTNWQKDDWGVLSVISGGRKEYGNPGEIARRALKVKRD